MHSKPTPKGRPFIMCEVALHLSEYGVNQDLALGRSNILSSEFGFILKALRKPKVAHSQRSGSCDHMPFEQ